MPGTTTGTAALKGKTITSVSRSPPRWRDALAAAAAKRAAKTELELNAAEEERKRREAEEEARAAQVEAAKERAQAGLTPEEIRKAEELANWAFIKDSTNPDEFRDHLARFEGGTTDRYARKKLEALFWEEPATLSNVEALRKFLDEFPNGDHAVRAQADLAVLEERAEAERKAEEGKRAETEAWAKALPTTLIADFEEFLRQWPDGEHAAAAKARIKDLRGSRFSRRGLLEVFYIGAAATAVGGTLSYLAAGPDQWLWWRMHYQSIRTLLGHTGAVVSVVFSPDGGTALSGSYDKTLKLWDVAAGREDPDVQRAYGGGQLGCLFHRWPHWLVWQRG